MHAESRERDTPAGGLSLVLGSVMAVQACATLTILALATLAPSAALTLGVGAESVGYQVSLAYLAAATVSGFAGTVVRRWGAGTTSIVATVLVMVGAAGIASGSLFLTVLTTVILGAGYGLTNPAASHLLNRFTPPRQRNVVFSLKQTGVPIGGVLAGFVLPAIAERAGWQAAVAGCALLAGALILLLAPSRRGWDADRVPNLSLRGALLSGATLVWRDPGLRSLGLMGFCFSATQLSLMAFAVTFLVTELGWSLVAAGSVAAAVQATGAVSRILWGALADRLGRGAPVLATIGVLSFIAALATSLLGPGTPEWVVVAVLCAFGLSSIGWNGVFLADVARISAAGDVGSATGGALLFTFAGVVLGPSLYATLYAVMGSYAATFALIGVLPLGGSLALAGLIRAR